MEKWISIKDYDGYYEVSSFGRVKSLDRTIITTRGSRNFKGRILKQYLDGSGYNYVGLSKNGLGKKLKVHHLVWENFKTEKRNGIILQVDHIDENKQNNNLENLQLLTPRQNTSKGFKKYNNTSDYTGVSWFKSTSKWRSQIYLNGKVLHLGFFEDELSAYNEYKKKLKKTEKNDLEAYNFYI